jgi:SpoVK/Ycf46/Vps4 family AAA+-type ATPase
MATAPRYHLDEVVLAATTRQHLDEALVKLQFSDLIYRDWGFAKVDPLGNGASFNFYGPSGTGKTRTAEALAGTLNLPFLCVLPGTLENKYMGETPKNIQRIFAKAKAEGALLFFDEAESLFGRRASDVTQGIDHEVNVTKSMLLAEMERFDGVMVIATNFQENYDAAFRRRIQFHIQFPLPDRLALEGLMEQFLVPDIPLGGSRQNLIQGAVDYCDALEGDIRMSGGDLVSALRISLSKAVLAGPANNRRLQAEHILAALQEVQDNKQQIGRKPSAPKSFDPSKSTQLLTDLYNRRPELNP